MYKFNYSRLLWLGAVLVALLNMVWVFTEFEFAWAVPFMTMLSTVLLCISIQEICRD